MDHKKFIFSLFFISGFCGLVYQVVWLRLAYASFGINSQIMSVTLSTFMAGLAIGSFFMGKASLHLRKVKNVLGLEIYALMEACIGMSAFLVPSLFRFGEKILLRAGEINSPEYFAVSAGILVLALLPWCILMGATIPLMMENIKILFPERFSNERTFSYLYLANTAGATIGVITTAVFLIELFGFSGTLFIAASMNALLATSVLFVARSISGEVSSLDATQNKASEMPTESKKTFFDTRLYLVILFTTGAYSMGLEVVWVRWFTPLLSTTIYAFAYILALYLLGTCVGLWKYKRDAERGKTLPVSRLLILVLCAAFFQIVINDPAVYSFVNSFASAFALGGATFSVYLARFLEISAGIFGITATVGILAYLFGYLTPKQIDEASKNDPALAGRAYAINVAGCIVGPLVVSYMLLPALGVKLSVLVLNVLLLLVSVFYLWSRSETRRLLYVAVGGILVTILIFSFSSTYEDGPNSFSKRILRDSSATVIALGEGRNKQLLVNGAGITHMTPVTKTMAALPFTHLKTPPKKALVICFGMGTTFRSSLSFGVDTTGVDLSAAVINQFGYFFPDAESLLKNPKAHLVVDDGRRFLLRTREKFDVITIDPPPPVTAAGSSLLYSKDFYLVLKERLSDGGILQQWYPYLEGYNDSLTLLAVKNSLTASFPYVAAFPSMEGWGYHFLASEQPIENLTADQFVKRLNKEATQDLLEWTPDLTAKQLAEKILPKRVDLNSGKIDDSVSSTIITDNIPYNEYYLIRSFLF